MSGEQRFQAAGEMAETRRGISLRIHHCRYLARDGTFWKISDGGVITRRLQHTEQFFPGAAFNGIRFTETLPACKSLGNAGVGGTECRKIAEEPGFQFLDDNAIDHTKPAVDTGRRFG